MRGKERIVDESTGEVLDPKTSPDYYTLDALRHADIWTPENLEREYRRLYKIVKDRMRTIAKSEIGRASKTYFYNKDRFKPLSELKSYEVKIGVAEMARMIQARTGTLGGIKRQRALAIKKFHKHGYTFVNEGNLKDIGEFFRQWKDSQFRGYGSTVALDFYEAMHSAEAQERAVTKTDKSAEVLDAYEKWLNDKNSEKNQNVNEISSAELLEALKEFL